MKEVRDLTNRLQEFRIQHGETQRKMADVMGIKTTGAYCKKELGYIPVSLEEAYAAAAHWGVTIEEIFLQIKFSEKKEINFLEKILL